MMNVQISFNQLTNLAFTLIELLIVITIMATLSGMIFVAYEQSDSDALTGDAYELQTVLQRARSMAINTGKVHAVTFHIENAGDGTVFKNRSEVDPEDFPGRHWYCIIGPDNAKSSGRGQWEGGRSHNWPPLATSDFFAAPDYIKAVRQVQAGPSHYLSKGVRFLALTDTDDIHSYDTHASYPRPWFGYYDELSNTLYPWGGYNRDIDAGLSSPNTGIDYEGADGPIPYDAVKDTNVNPSQVWGRLHYDPSTKSGAVSRSPNETGNSSHIKNHYGFTADYVGPDTSMMPGTNRPVINGYWCDYIILFNAKGEAFSGDSSTRDVFFNRNNWGTTKEGRAHMELRNLTKLSGGFYLTLCRDVDPENIELYHETNPITGQAAYNKFRNAEEAFESISPFLRVYINKITGKSEVHNNEHPYMRITPDDLKQKNPFPRGF